MKKISGIGGDDSDDKLIVMEERETGREREKKIKYYNFFYF